MMTSGTPRTGIVVGENGYLGRNLVRVLSEMGWTVRSYDLQEVSAIGTARYEKLDIRDSDQLSRVDWSVDAVFVFAGLTGTSSGFDRYREFISVNEIGLLALLDSIRHSDARPRIVFPSTRLVYRGSQQPLREDAPKEAKTVYAANKLVSEHYLGAYANAFDLAYTVYRICVPYGSVVAGDYSYGTVGTFLRQVHDNQVIRLYGDGSLRRTFSHVSDICRRIIRTCLDIRTNNDIFNIGGDDVSLGEAAVIVANQLNARIEYVDWPEKDARMESGHTVFDASKLHAIDGSSEAYHFCEWVKQTFGSHRGDL